ncbi:MAG: DUF4176 domain-containing protein [Bacilli bacterium]|jgi:hypothetical protein|nr:DUF4176 domain-containing protein [Bacilli bacterium]
MNEIQQDYLIGLVHKQLDQYNLEELVDVNINNDKYIEYINDFIDKNVLDNDLITSILDFLNGNENYYENGLISIEKIGAYVSVTDELEHFTMLCVDFNDLLSCSEQYLKEYLPLGSIVKIEKDDKLVSLVIEQRMVQPKGKDYFIDYRGIPYPMGVFNDSMYVYFNAENIEEVVFVGYTDLENDGYELMLKESLISNKIYHKDYLVEKVKEDNIEE